MSFITKKGLIIINMLTTIYFLGLYLVWLAQVKFVLIGVFVELLTLPVMVLQAFCVLKSIQVLYRTKFKAGTLLLSILLAVACLFFIVFSFIY